MAKIIAPLLRGLTLAALTFVAAAAQEPARTPEPAPAPGAVVRDADGAVLGRIETVVTDRGGRPVQVVVRSRTAGGVRSALRALPAASLRPAADGFATPLRKAEFEVLPPIRR